MRGQQHDGSRIYRSNLAASRVICSSFGDLRIRLEKTIVQTFATTVHPSPGRAGGMRSQVEDSRPHVFLVWRAFEHSLRDEGCRSARATRLPMAACPTEEGDRFRPVA